MANTYDVANRVTAVTGTLTGTPTPYLSGMSYAAQGAPAAYTYGNQLARAYTYNNRLQATEMTDSSTASTNSLLDLQFFYGGSTVLNGNSTANNGNVTQMVLNTSQKGAPVTSFTQTYAYDSVNRITSASDTGPWQQTFNYDQFGNMWSPYYTGLPSQPLMPSLQSAYTAVTNQLAGQSYDAAGNQLVFASSNLAYDAENRQATATDNTGSGSVVTYAYDGLGERVSKSSSATGVTTIYVHDAFGNLAVEYNSPTTSPCTTCYLSWDHLGSTRMVTDASVVPVTAPKALHDYVPFGVEIPAGYAGRTALWGVSDGLSPKFTGQDRDTDTGLDFFQARYMGTAQGRFTSPDPAGNSVADPSNPQSWNLYSYVWNNPLALVDPSGLDPDCTSDASCGDPCDDTLFICGGGWFPGGGGGYPPPPYVPPPPTPVPNPTTGPYGNNVLPGMSGSPQSFWDYLQAYWSTTGFLANFITGTGRTNRYYGPMDYRARDLMSSGGFQAINQQINLACQAGKTGGNLNLSTPGAAQEIPYDILHSPVGGQVGGYNGSWAVNGNTATVTIVNNAGLNSFLYHIPPNAPWTRGPGRTIHQTFVIKEPSPCGGG